jgi:hypothetical protein
MCGGKGGSCFATAVGGDQVGAGALVEAVSETPRWLRRQGSGGNGGSWAGVEATSQVSEFWAVSAGGSN